MLPGMTACPPAGTSGKTNALFLLQNSGKDRLPFLHQQQHRRVITRHDGLTG